MPQASMKGLRCGGGWGDSLDVPLRASVAGGWVGWGWEVEKKEEEDDFRSRGLLCFETG